MNKKPLTFVEKVVITLSGIGVLAIFAYVLYLYPSLPDIVPTHYNIYGEPDDFGGKRWIWFGPFIALVLFVGITAVSFFVKEFNSFVEITEENRERQYKNGRLMSYVLACEIVLYFLLHTVRNTEMLKGNTSIPNGIQPYVFIGIIMGTLLFFIIRSFRLK